MLCSAAWLPGDISWHDINRESSKMGPLGHGTLISSLDPSAGPQQQVWLASSMRGLGEEERSAQAQGTRESGESGFNSPNHGFEMEMGGEWKEGWRAVKIWWEATSFLDSHWGKIRIEVSFWKANTLQSFSEAQDLEDLPPKELHKLFFLRNQ